MKVTKITGLGSEIVKAVQRNNGIATRRHNIKKAKEYLKYCKAINDTTLIAYAEKKLREAQA